MVRRGRQSGESKLIVDNWKRTIERPCVGTVDSFRGEAWFGSLTKSAKAPQEAGMSRLRLPFSTTPWHHQVTHPFGKWHEIDFIIIIPESSLLSSPLPFPLPQKQRQSHAPSSRLAQPSALDPAPQAQEDRGRAEASLYTTPIELGSVNRAAALRSGAGSCTF
jgi:hypothetical protein